MGKAYIIGTGPGDEELLTIKAVKVLEKCTAVLYDRLVSNNILNYLKEDCEIYYCGKEPGCHYKTQEEINEMIVKLVKDGHIVGRIKGGDPYVFGRGGEEVLSLQKEGLEFEVIPGVTSPIAVLNYAGIPITQRGMSQGFHIITGMTAAGEKINWQALAKETGTLVFMMGLENIERIMSNLLENGKDGSTPAAIVMRGTSSKQKKVIGTVDNICAKAREAGLKVDTTEFDKLFKEHQEKSRMGSEQKFKGGLAGTGEQEVRYHTTTHLLNAALKVILGKDVHQKGSNITPERMRFDFSCDHKLTDDEKKKVEDLVNEWISRGLDVKCEEMKKDDAIKSGAECMFIEKYPDIVTVYSIGNDKETVSKELCGGPHVKNTSELGHFKIKKEEASSAGVRRIKAILE